MKTRIFMCGGHLLRINASAVPRVDARGLFLAPQKIASEYSRLYMGPRYDSRAQ